LRNSDVRLLAAVGAFRVIDAQDFKVTDRWHGDVEHLRSSGLVDVSPRVLDGQRTAVVTLTRAGQELLEQSQQKLPPETRQAFYAGVVKPRELAHDAQLYRAYAASVARLYEQGARIRRVVLDYELKRDYQRFLQANNRAHHRSSGRPDRSKEEIGAWAEAHGLSVVNDHVQFPDVRVEYEHADGREGREDIEVTTADYNGRQLAAKRAAGFTMHGSRAGRLGGGSQRGGGSPFDPHAAERVLQ
jgi:DNA-binding MarR family transcriptional regulator